MLEKMLLAAIFTVCIYLFINLGGKPSNSPSLDAGEGVVPRFFSQASFPIW